jgi:hypothetical protein
MNDVFPTEYKISLSNERTNKDRKVYELFTWVTVPIV